MIAVADVASRAARVLTDLNYVRWTEPELVGWAADAVLAIITRDPSAGAAVQTVTLAAGTLQTLPTSGIRLLGVVRNITASGGPGRVIRLTDQQALDDSDPDWHSSMPGNEVRQYTFDERVPKAFYVYPPALDGIKVELKATWAPPAVTDIADSLAMDEVYRPAIVDYVCYRAMSKDDDAANLQKASMFYSAFADAIGGQNSVATATSPNQVSA